MSFILKEELLQSQDVWKRSQIRLTPTLYNAVLEYASEHDLSLNSALMHLTDEGLVSSKKSGKRKVIFTEYNPIAHYDDYSPSNNEAIRMECAEFITRFFNDHPDHEFMQLESKTTTNKKGQEVMTGVRIWYSYTG